MSFLRTTALLVFALVTSLSGCAIFRANDLPEVGSLPGPAAASTKPNAGYAFISHSSMGAKTPVQGEMLAKQEDEFAKVLRDSGYFASVNKANGKDVNISIDLLESGDPAAMVGAFITGFSLFTIPSWATIDMQATCTVVTADGKSRTYTLKDSVTMVNWLPMVLVFPFKNFSEVEALRQNIYKTLIVKMQADGILPKAGQPAKTGHRTISALVPAG
jgi:hypothetical protein